MKVQIIYTVEVSELQRRAIAADLDMGVDSGKLATRAQIKKWYMNKGTNAEAYLDLAVFEKRYAKPE